MIKLRRVIKQPGELHEGHLTRWGGGSSRSGSGKECAGKEKSGKQTKAGLGGARDTLGPSIHLKEGGPKDGEVRS